MFLPPHLHAFQTARRWFHDLVVLIFCAFLTLFGEAARTSARPSPPKKYAAAATRSLLSRVRPDAALDEDAQRLEPGKVLSVVFANGEPLSFRLSLQSDQYVRLSVKAGGVNTTTLLSADGKFLAGGVASPEKPDEQSIQFIAEVGGDYLLKVQPLANAASSGCEVELAEVRAATPADVLLVAKASFAEGTSHAGVKTREELLRAVDKFQQAIRLYRRGGDEKGEANATYRCASAYFAMDDFPAALDLYVKALPLIEAHGDPNQKDYILLNMGLVNFNLGENYAALENFELALSRFRQYENKLGEARTLSELTRAYYLLGDHQQALNYGEQALQSCGGITDTRQQFDCRLTEGYTLDLLGRINFALGENEEAQRYFEEALARLSNNDEKRYASTLTDLGRLYSSTGKNSEALVQFEEALAIYRKTGRALGEAETLAYRGMVYASQGDAAGALKDFADALAIQRRIHDVRGEGDTLYKIGMAYQATGDQAKALDGFTKSLEFWRANQYRPGQVSSLYRMAHLNNAQGELQAARSQIEAALEIAESLRENVVSSNLRVSYLASVRDYYELYIDLLMQMHRRDPRSGFDKLALGVSERARARALLDSLSESKENIRLHGDAQLLARARQLQLQLASEADLQIRLLSNQISKERVEAARKKLTEIEREYERVQTQIRLSNPNYAALVKPHTLTASQIQTQELAPDTLLLEYALGEERSYLWVVSPTEVHSFTLVGRAHLDAAVHDFTKLLTQGNQDSNFNELYVREANKLGQLLLGDAAPLLASKRLVIVCDAELQYVPFSALGTPQPTQPPLKGGVAARGGAFEPLISTHEILMEPSLSTLAMTRQLNAHRQTGTSKLAIIANPVFDREDERVRTHIASLQQGQAASPPGGELASGATRSPSPSAAKLRRSADELHLAGAAAPIPPLYFSREEAEAIYRLAKPRGAMLATDFAANRETFTGGSLSRYSIVHISTHALLNDDHPELSGIVLSLVDEQGKARDGFLQLYEVFNLNLPADLVVLSACQTALGKEIKGEGLMSLTRGFMYAGASRVAATLWKVDDEASKELMILFYRKMLVEKLSPAAALRESQMAMWKRKGRMSNPYFWAPFVLQGEWR
jgi:CHAT domain-containing protein